MNTHCYIELCVESELDRSTARLWLNTVRENLPSGVPAAANIRVKGQPKNTDFYLLTRNNNICYRVPLSRDLSITEVQKIVIAWNLAYPQGDFEIDYSSQGTARAKMQEVTDVGIKQIALEAARQSHSQWLQTMTEQGWRYSQKFNQQHKTNPKLRPWDELGSKYKIQELDRFLKLMEVLDRMNLRLARKMQ